MNISQALSSVKVVKKTKARDKTLKESHYVQIKKFYFEGLPQSEIAKILGISPSQVAKDLEVIRQRWVHETILDIDVIKAEQLKRIDSLEQEYRRCFERSKRVKVVKTQRGGVFANNPTGNGEFEIIEEEEIGDPKYLQGIQWCISERSKITGAYAPKKIAETDPTGTKEAGSVAREEILSMLADIKSKATSLPSAVPQQLQLSPAKPEDYIDAELVEDGAEEDTSKATLELIKAKTTTVYADQTPPVSSSGTAQDSIALNKRHNIQLHNQMSDISERINHK